MDKDALIENINKITRSINNGNIKNIEKIMDERFNMMKKVIPLVQNNERVFLLPFVVPDYYVSKSVAIVGNSRNLLEKKNGREIDNHDMIFRLNYAVVDNFEEYCGKSNNIRVMLPIVLKGEKYPRHPTGLVKDYKFCNKINNTDFLVLIHQPNRTKKKIDLQSIAKKNNIDPTNKIYKIDWEKKNFDKIISKFKFKLNKGPQIGFGVILLFISLGIKVDIYGFDIEICDTNYGYYWSKIKHKKISVYHDHRMEHKILKFFNSKLLLNIN